MSPNDGAPPRADEAAETDLGAGFVLERIAVTHPVDAADAHATRGAAWWLWIDRPQRRNAIDPAMWHALERWCAQLRGDVVVIAGRGPAGMCAGFDVRALAGAAATQPPDASLIAAMAAMAAADAVFIAAAHGHVIGAGVELFAACDLRCVTTDVTLRVPAGELGVVYHPDGVTRLVGAFGPGLAARLLLAGERVDAAALQAAGIAASEPLPRDADGLTSAAVAQVEALARRVASTAEASRSAHVRALRAIGPQGFEPQARAEYEARRAAAYASEDHARGREAWLAARTKRTSPADGAAAGGND